MRIVLCALALAGCRSLLPDKPLIDVDPCKDDDCVCADFDCEVDCDRRGECQLSCSGDALCELACGGAPKCEVAATGGSEVVVDCTKVGECNVECATATSCAVDCTGSDCDIVCPETGCEVTGCDKNNCTVLCGFEPKFPRPNGTITCD